MTVVPGHSVIDSVGRLTLDTVHDGIASPPPPYTVRVLVDRLLPETRDVDGGPHGAPSEWSVGTPGRRRVFGGPEVRARSHQTRLSCPP